MPYHTYPSLLGPGAEIIQIMHVGSTGHVSCDYIRAHWVVTVELIVPCHTYFCQYRSAKVLSQRCKLVANTLPHLSESAWPRSRKSSKQCIVVPTPCLGKGVVLAKFDVESAYCTVPVYPQSSLMLGLKWKGATYVDGALPFGLPALKVFTAIADALQWIMHQHGVRNTIVARVLEQVVFLRFGIGRVPDSIWTETPSLEASKVMMWKLNKKASHGTTSAGQEHVWQNRPHARPSPRCLAAGPPMHAIHHKWMGADLRC